MFADEFKNRYTTIPFAFCKFKAIPENYSLFVHHHKELEIIAIYDGKADFYIGSTRYEIKTGDVLIIPPYCVHRAFIPAGTSYDCICFDLSLLWDIELKEALESGKLTVNTHLLAEEADTLQLNRYAREAIVACERNALGWEMETIGLLSLFFAKLNRKDFFVKADAFSETNKFEKLVIQYIKEHFSEQITSTTVAKTLYINNSYFCRLFKKAFGCCFSDYLVEYRIGRAKLYLNGTTMPISKIAFAIGFNSFSYFSKAFKRSVGISPTEYRQKK